MLQFVAGDVVNASTAAAVASADFARPQNSAVGRFDGSIKAVVPFVFDAITTGHLVAPVTFGTKAANVDYDTGGANFLIPSAAARLGFQPGGGLNGEGVGSSSVNGGFAAIGVVAFGTARLDRQDAVVEPLPYGFAHPRAGLTLDGLVGAELDAAFLVTFDYTGRTITLAPFGTPAPPGTTVPLYQSGSHPYVEATIDGVTGLFGIDTGDGGGLTVFRRFATAHGLFTNPGAAYASPGGVGGKIDLQYYRAKSFVLGGTTLAAPTVDVTDTTGGAFASRSIAGNIGAQILDRYTMTINLRAHTATFSPNVRVAEPFNADRTGLSLDQTAPDAFNVLNVTLHSPADEAVVRPGDRIVVFNGRDISQQHLGTGDIRGTLTTQTKPLPLTVMRGTQRLTVVIMPRAIV